MGNRHVWRDDVANHRVKSNEAPDAQGDGHTATDWQVTGDETLLLRAERSGAGPTRIYSINMQASDAAGEV